MSVVGGYDPRILTARRQQILQKVMAQHMQQKQASPLSGMSSLQAATAAQVGGGPQMGGSGGRPNAAHIGVTQGQNLSQSILARLGLTVPRALHGEMSQAPGGAIDHFNAGPPNGAAAMQMLNPYPGDPGAPQGQGIQQAPQGGVAQSGINGAAPGVTPFDAPTGMQFGGQTFQGFAGPGFSGQSVDPGSQIAPSDATGLGGGLYFSPSTGFFNMGDQTQDPSSIIAGMGARRLGANLPY